MKKKIVILGIFAIVLGIMWKGYTIFQKMRQEKQSVSFEEELEFALQKAKQNGNYIVRTVENTNNNSFLLAPGYELRTNYQLTEGTMRSSNLYLETLCSGESEHNTPKFQEKYQILQIKLNQIVLPNYIENPSFPYYNNAPWEDGKVNVTVLLKDREKEEFIEIEFLNILKVILCVD